MLLVTDALRCIRRILPTPIFWSIILSKSKTIAACRLVKDDSLAMGCGDGHMMGPFYLTYSTLSLFKMFILYSMFHI